MPLQFQSVGAVAPLLGSKFGMSLADIGLLIGFYFTPGIALALAGGGLGQRFGDKQTVLAGLMLMLIGELAMASSPTWTVQVAGRLVSGAGGVLLTVQMTKMVTDWFAGREIATAMAIFDKFLAGRPWCFRCWSADRHAVRGGYGRCRGGGPDRLGAPASPGRLSIARERKPRYCESRATRSPRYTCSGGGWPDVGPLQRRTCHDL